MIIIVLEISDQIILLNITPPPPPIPRNNININRGNYALHQWNYHIIIQRKSGKDQPNESPTEGSTNPSVKRKSFAPVEIDKTPYHQLQRVPLEKIPDKERNTNIIEE